MTEYEGIFVFQNPFCRNSEHTFAGCKGTGPFCWPRTLDKMEA